MSRELEARIAVRKLLERFDEINALRLGVAYVLAKRDSAAYESILVEAESVARNEMAASIRSEHAPVYAALDDSSQNWCEVLLKTLGPGPRVFVPKSK
jgi:hypothetical protein